MDPITTAQLGMSTTYATRDNEPAPTARPSSAVPIGRPMATIDPKARSRITIATARPRASPTPVGACSNAKYRSPPASMRSSVESRRSSRVALSLSRSAGDSSARSGYWIRIRATRPSGDTRSLVPSTCGSARHGFLDPVRVGPRTGASKVSSGSRGVRTTSAPRPMSADPACVRSSVARCESSPGASNGSSSSRPNAAAEVTTTTQTAAHVAITTQGRRAANRPSRSSAPDTVGLLGVRPAFGHAGQFLHGRGAGVCRHIGVEAGMRSCFRPGANQTFGRSWRAPAFPRLGR